MQIRCFWCTVFQNKHKMNKPSDSVAPFVDPGKFIMSDFCLVPATGLLNAACGVIFSDSISIATTKPGASFSIRKVSTLQKRVNTVCSPKKGIFPFLGQYWIILEIRESRNFPYFVEQNVEGRNRLKFVAFPSFFEQNFALFDQKLEQLALYSYTHFLTIFVWNFIFMRQFWSFRKNLVAIFQIRDSSKCNLKIPLFGRVW